jgi:hypothetical protein
MAYPSRLAHLHLKQTFREQLRPLSSTSCVGRSPSFRMVRTDLRRGGRPGEEIAQVEPLQIFFDESPEFVTTLSLVCDLALRTLVALRWLSRQCPLNTKGADSQVEQHPPVPFRDSNVMASQASRACMESFLRVLRHSRLNRIDVRAIGQPLKTGAGDCEPN